jgi:hypothetical protein
LNSIGFDGATDQELSSSECPLLADIVEKDHFRQRTKFSDTLMRSPENYGETTPSTRFPMCAFRRPFVRYRIDDERGLRIPREILAASIF